MQECYVADNLLYIYCMISYKKEKFINVGLLYAFMSDKSLFLEVMGDSPINRVLDFLITFKDFDYSLTDVCGNSDVSWSTLHLFWKDLERNRIVKQTRVVGKAKMFRLDEANPVVKELVRMHWLIAKTYTDRLFRKVEVLA
ncbi:Uncharacterised protein [uncultured archaeon]|nr:Uncharacterised protein [uncultured archaeon]